MNEISISYYENMIDLINENQKINEEIMTPKFMKYFTESKEEITIYENKVTDSILKFLQKIFDKVIEFFKKIINFISDIKNFTPNKKLITSVEDKIKYMSKEEKDDFSIEIELNYINKNNQYLDYLIERSENGLTYLEDIVYNIKDLMYKDTQSSELDKELDSYDLEIKESTKSKLIIKYNDLKEVISQYENMYSRVRSLRKQLQADQMNINNYKKTIDSLVKRNDNIENNDILNKYKEIAIKICNFTMKVNNDIIKEMTYSFKVYESILKSLISNNNEVYNFSSFDEKIFYQSIKNKDYLRLKVNVVSAISYDPRFEKGEAEKVLMILKKEIPEIFEDYKQGDYEERLNKDKWDKRYFSKLLYWFQENFSENRIPYIKEVGRAVHKD